MKLPAYFNGGCCIPVENNFFGIFHGEDEYRQCAKGSSKDKISGFRFCHVHDSPYLYYTKIEYCKFCGKIIPEEKCFDWLDSKYVNISRADDEINKLKEEWETCICRECKKQKVGTCKICGRYKPLRRAGKSREWKVCSVCKDIIWYGYEKRRGCNKYGSEYFVEWIMLNYIKTGFKQHEKERKNVRRKNSNTKS